MCNTCRVRRYKPDLGFEDTNQNSSVWSGVASADLPFRSETASPTPLTLLCPRLGRLIREIQFFTPYGSAKWHGLEVRYAAPEVICDVSCEEAT